MNRANHRLVITMVTALICGGQALGAPQGTAFTYQGRLSDDGILANAEYDFRVLLYDSADGGDYVSIATLNEVPVIDGLFSVELDFGPQAFGSEGRWLEITIRPGEMNGIGGYTTLSPRQPVSGAPHSLSTRGIHVSSDGKVGLGDQTAPEVLLDVRGGGLLVHDDAGQGISLLSSQIHFDALTGDTVYRYTELQDKHEFFTGLATSVEPRLVIDAAGNVGVGTATPSSPLTVNGDIECTAGGVKFADGSLQTTASPWQVTPEGDAHLPSGGVKFADGSLQTSAAPWQRTFSGDAELSFGNAGIGTDAPTATLHLSRPLEETAIRFETTRSDSGPPASTGQSTSSVAVVGAGAAWSTPQNSLASDNQWATATLTQTTGGVDNDTSKGLVFSDFGFNLPPDASVIGVQVEVEAHETSSYVYPAQGSLVILWAQVNGEDDVEGFLLEGSTDSNHTLELTAELTGADVNSPAFAIRLSSELRLQEESCGWIDCTLVDCADCAGNATVSIDEVKVTLTYFDPSATLTGHDFAIGVPADSDALVIGPGTSPASPSNQPWNAALVVTSEGNVGINKIPESGQFSNWKLDVAGKIRCQTLTETSSRRFKTEVRPISGALDTIQRLQGVTFTWDAEHGSRPDIGFIAEEVGAVLPEIVEYEADGVNAAGMNYDRIGALAVEAIKELNTQVAEQRRQIQSLQAELTTLRGQRNTAPSNSQP